MCHLLEVQSYAAGCSWERIKLHVPYIHRLLTHYQKKMSYSSFTHASCRAATSVSILFSSRSITAVLQESSISCGSSVFFCVHDSHNSSCDMKFWILCSFFPFAVCSMVIDLLVKLAAISFRYPLKQADHSGSTPYCLRADWHQLGGSLRIDYNDPSYHQRQHVTSNSAPDKYRLITRKILSPISFSHQVMKPGWPLQITGLGMVAQTTCTPPHLDRPTRFKGIQDIIFGSCW